METKQFDQIFIPLPVYRKPKAKKPVKRYAAICQAPNKATVERITGKHTSKNGFKKELRRRGYTVKDIFIQ